MIDKNIILSNNELSKDVTYKNAKNNPIQNWFPYLEGFAENFIDSIFKSTNREVKFVYEPFSGTGTVPFYCKKNNINVYYSEVNPFLISLTNMKVELLQLEDSDLEQLNIDLSYLINNIEQLIENQKENTVLKDTYLDTFKKSIYFNESNFSNILKFKNLIDSYKNNLLSQILNISVCYSLLACSNLKRSGDIRFRKGKELDQIQEIIPTVYEKLITISKDIINLKKEFSINKSFVANNNNSKEFIPDIENKIDLIVTSPPYLNGTNYIRNTKLELWFCGALKKQSDLNYFRKEVVTSGINDVTKNEKYIEIPRLEKILNDKGLWYDQRIPKMIRDYFYDMNIVIENFSKYLKNDGYVFLDIGDSIYANNHIPTDEILIDIFKAHNFNIIDNVLLRERRSKSGQIVKQTLIIAKK
ncbi:DNA adenine methylase [Empedobacter sp. 225-1]|uniref:DNA adenine methylase n=1 Tax=Empedobacter sp. 225-1 TaxID=2746725 RepID=UPI0025785D64|nr:DNA adenine methylase [Empedobacter sp. 225-1]MDM1521725.1 DNA adenine methylase [Empedobacter sp. 225-1]